MQKGYIQVYTGNGKGKTTAALGLALRAVGRGFRVIIVQFLKGSPTGELESIKKLAPHVSIIRFGESKKFVFKMNDEELVELKLKIEEEMDGLGSFLDQNPCDILILDEILGTINEGLIPVERVLELLDTKPEGMEIVLTGRDVPESIANKADLITEMVPVKHYMDAGIPARIGIEK